jgi:hypothetical protein
MERPVAGNFNQSATAPMALRTAEGGGAALYRLLNFLTGKFHRAGPLNRSCGENYLLKPLFDPNHYSSLTGTIDAPFADHNPGDRNAPLNPPEKSGRFSPFTFTWESLVLK